MLQRYCVPSRPLDHSLWGVRSPIKSLYATVMQEEDRVIINILPFPQNSPYFELKFQLYDPAYAVDSRLLDHTKIRPLDRQKLKSWLMAETHNRYARETYGLASKYLDMFFAKGCTIAKSSFQILGIACLMLAAKMHERRLPAISFQVFDKQEILNLERQLGMLFHYKLNPITYFTITEVLVSLWDGYLQDRNPFKKVTYSTEDLSSILRFRVIMETLDCLDLTTESLNIEPIDLVFTTFYIEHRKFCLSSLYFNEGVPLLQTTQNQSFHLMYHSFMLQFLKDLKNRIPMFSSIKFSYFVLSFVLQFSRLNPKIDKRKYINFRYEISKQTYNPEISKLAQRYLHRRAKN